MFCRVRLHQEWQRDVSRTASSAHFSVARDSLSPSLRPLRVARLSPCSKMLHRCQDRSGGKPTESTFKRSTRPWPTPFSEIHECIPLSLHFVASDTQHNSVKISSSRYGRSSILQLVASMSYFNVPRVCTLTDVMDYGVSSFTSPSVQALFIQVLDLR